MTVSRFPSPAARTPRRAVGRPSTSTPGGVDGHPVAGSRTPLVLDPAPATWLGVDPGARWCGLVVRRGRELLHHAVLERDGGTDAAWLSTVVAYTAHTLTLVGVTHRTLPRVAVEGVVAPNPHVRRRDGNSLTDVSPLLGAAMVLGAVLARWDDAIVVRPGGHGSKALGAYPEDLVSAGEKRRGGWQLQVGTGMLRHARSAWDIAGAAALEARWAEAGR